MIYPDYRIHPRRYGKRLAAGESRTVMLSVRVSSKMKDALAYLAARHQLSLGEYAARVLNDHMLRVLPRS